MLFRQQQDQFPTPPPISSSARHVVKCSIVAGSGAEGEVGEGEGEGRAGGEQQEHEGKGTEGMGRGKIKCLLLPRQCLLPTRRSPVSHDGCREDRSLAES